MKTTEKKTGTEIYLEKRDRILVPSGPNASAPLEVGSPNFVLLATFNRNLNSLGYTMTPELMGALAGMEEKDLFRLSGKVFRILKARVGAHRVYQPMYPNFPKQVMEASEAELYFNALLHYFGSFLADVTGVPIRFLPEYKKEARPDLPESEIQVRVLRLGDEKDFDSIFTTLAAANGSLSPSDREILTWFVDQKKKKVVSSLLPESIPQKENLAFLVGEFVRVGLNLDPLLPSLKTATDILRVAVALSKGDVSLAKPSRFAKLSRSHRRFLLSAFERVGSSFGEDVARRPEEFKRLAHALHPGEYRTRYPKTFEVFSSLREGNTVPTFSSRVEGALKKKDLPAVSDLLASRPGEFARRLDHLLRLSPKDQALALLLGFENVSESVSTPVLLSVYSHFRTRDNSLVRAFLPKGDVGRIHVRDNNLTHIPEDVIERCEGIARSALVRKFSKLSPLGKTFLDPALSFYKVPTGLRSASKALKTIVRGSEIPLGTEEITRLFIYWKDGATRTDIDLSVAFLDENFSYKTSVAFYALRNQGVYHSGDITSAPNGASEFIDLDLKKAQKLGRYAVMVLTSYTQQKFCDLPECFAGWMGRTEMNSGEVFDARTVRHRFDVATDRKVSIPVFFDLDLRTATWMDLGVSASVSYSTAKGLSSVLSRAVKGMKDVALKAPSLHDLFELHVEARGVSVSDPEGAETLFREDSSSGGIGPRDSDKILAEFLA